jgi:uncharacterized protein with FMN-binding domain
MRRAIITTAATVIGLVALLDYKSSGTISTSSSKVKVNLGSSGQESSSSTTTSPATTSSTGSTSSSQHTSSTTAVGATGSFTSPEVTYTYGALEVTVTLKDGKITAVSAPSNDAPDPHSEAINDQAVPILDKEAVAAQGVNIDVVSGATFTSEAFGQALKDALTKAGK